METMRHERGGHISVNVYGKSERIISLCVIGKNVETDWDETQEREREVIR